MLQIRYWEIWEHLKARLSTTRMLTALQGGKVYAEGDDYSLPEGPETKVWARLVLVPTASLWPEEPGVGWSRRIGFLTRAEVHSNKAAGYVPQKTLDAIQDECLIQLQNYLVPNMQYVRGAIPIFQNRPPQPIPLVDDDRGLFISSAEYRFEVTRPEVPSEILVTPAVGALSTDVVFIEIVEDPEDDGIELTL